MVLEARRKSVAGWRGVVAREVNIPGDVSCACHTGGPGAPGEMRKGCCNKGGGR